MMNAAELTAGLSDTVERSLSCIDLVWGENYRIVSCRTKDGEHHDPVAIAEMISNARIFDWKLSYPSGVAQILPAADIAQVADSKFATSIRLEDRIAQVREYRADSSYFAVEVKSGMRIEVGRMSGENGVLILPDHWVVDDIVDIHPPVYSSDIDPFDGLDGLRWCFYEAKCSPR